MNQFSTENFEGSATMMDRLNDNTHRCVDCDREFLRTDKNATDIRGPICQKKYFDSLLSEVEKSSAEFDYAGFAEEELDQIGYAQSAVVNSLFANDPDFQHVITKNGETLQAIDDFKNQMRAGYISQNDLYEYTLSNDLTLKKLATTVFYYKYAESISVELILELNDDLKYKFAEGYQTPVLILEALAQDKNNNLAIKAIQTLSIKRKVRSYTVKAK